MNMMGRLGQFIAGLLIHLTEVQFPGVLAIPRDPPITEKGLMDRQIKIVDHIHSFGSLTLQEFGRMYP